MNLWGHLLVRAGTSTHFFKDFSKTHKLFVKFYLQRGTQQGHHWCCAVAGSQQVQWDQARGHGGSIKWQSPPEPTRFSQPFCHRRLSNLKSIDFYSVEGRCSCPPAMTKVTQPCNFTENIPKRCCFLQFGRGVSVELLLSHWMFNLLCNGWR